MRIRSHILEEESRRAFRNIIPSEWIVRPQIPDYGLDEQVQIIKNGQITKYYFFVQIKGSDGIPNTQDSPTFRFKTIRLLQYINNPLPVMLVLYDSVGERLFYVWIHSIFRGCSADTRRKLELQKTLAVRFTNRLDNRNILFIERDVRHHYYWLGHSEYETPEDFAISISINLDESKRLQIIEKINQWIRSDYATKFIKMNNNTTPDGTIRVDSEPLSITFSYGDISTRTIKLQKDDEEEIFVENLVSTLKIAIAMITANCGLADISLDIIRRIVTEELLLSPEAEILLTLPTLAKIYAARDRVAEAMRVSEQLLKKGYINPARNLASSALHSASTPKYYYQQYRRFLKTAIDNVDNKVTKATLHYSLANNLCYDSYFKEAIFHYNHAAKSYSAYRKRSYWWAELGGCLFLLNKYIWSERCYKKAIELGEEKIPVRALLGDVLLHEGKFSCANVEFKKYLKKTKKPFAEFILKNWLVELLLKEFGDTQRNHSEAFRLAENAYNRKKPHIFGEALKLDPLCGYAWFNYAVAQSQKTQFSNYKDWLATAIIQEWDCEAWTNAIVALGFNTKAPPKNILIATVFYAHKLHEDNLIEEIKKRLHSQIPYDMIEKLLYCLIEDTRKLSHFFPEDDTITVRIFSKQQQSQGKEYS